MSGSQHRSQDSWAGGPAEAQVLSACSIRSCHALQVNITNTLKHMATVVEASSKHVSLQDTNAGHQALPIATAHSINLNHLPDPTLLSRNSSAPRLDSQAAMRAFLLRCGGHDWAILTGVGTIWSVLQQGYLLAASCCPGLQIFAMLKLSRSSSWESRRHAAKCKTCLQGTAYAVGKALLPHVLDCHVVSPTQTFPSSFHLQCTCRHSSSRLLVRAPEELNWLHSPVYYVYVCVQVAGEDSCPLSFQWVRCQSVRCQWVHWQMVHCQGVRFQWVH
jgi:hypothetical protein